MGHAPGEYNALPMANLMKSTLFMQILAAAAGLFLVFLVTTAAVEPPLLHPCHPGGPGGPGFGPPCPPTAVPAASSDSSQPSGTSGAGPVAFRIVNRTAEAITVWLGSPVVYVFNVAAGTEATYTVDRSVYVYTLASCGAETGGFMDLTTKSFFIADPCPVVHLVQIQVENRSDRLLAVHLAGPSALNFALSAGEVRTYTVARGEYDVEIVGCAAPQSLPFSAHTGRILTASCP